MKLGIALGGGGAKGFAHIGVLEAFNAAGIKFDVVTGTSIGAIVGAAYSSGNLPQLTERANSIKLTEVPRLLSPSFPISGLFSGKNAIELLTEIVGVELIEDLPIKFGAVSADIDTGEEYEFTSGNVSQALRASFAIPGLFSPVVCDDRVLVDGGTVEPVPVELARKLGADIVVAIDLFSNTSKEVAPKTELIEDKGLWPVNIDHAIQYLKSASENIQWLNSDSPKLIDILQKTVVISQKRLTELRFSQCKPDYCIAPPVIDVAVLDFHLGEPIIEIGRRASSEVVSELKKNLNC